MAAPAQQVTVQAGQTDTGEGAHGVLPQPAQLEPVPPKRAPSHYLWAVLIARFLRFCGTDRSYTQRTSSVLN